MKPETINLALGVFGTITGSLALLIQYLGHRADRASLRVAATMSFGSSRNHGREQHHFMTVRLTNGGRRIVRIQSVALRVNPSWRVTLNEFLFRHQLTKRIVQPDIGIYSGAVDPVHEIMRNPQIRSYPPPTVVLDENQMVELHLIVAEDLIPLLPKRMAWLIVTDHVGTRHKARYLPIDCGTKIQTDSQQTGSTESSEAARSASSDV